MPDIPTHYIGYYGQRVPVTQIHLSALWTAKAINGREHKIVDIKEETPDQVSTIVTAKWTKSVSDEDDNDGDNNHEVSRI